MSILKVQNNYSRIMKYNFSIIIPSYNNIELFKRALSSVEMQIGTSWELIVVDDSTTNAISLATKLYSKDSRIKYFHNTPPLGAVPNWNKGLKLATGKYIILLHHDEAFTSKTHLLELQKLLDLGYDIAISSIIVYKQGVPYHKTSPTLTTRFVANHPELLFMINKIGACACMAVRKTEIQYFNEKLNWLVDVDWYYRMLKNKKCAFLDSTYKVASIHGHKGQITTTIAIEDMLNKDIGELKKTYANKYNILFFVWVYKTLFKNKKLRNILKSVFRK